MLELINGIAGQANLLALNTAIEAAPADMLGVLEQQAAAA
jgi:methyl-accepting chemotaxis protein